MNEVKPHLSYERQINKLRKKGCIIDDDSFYRDILVNIDYYRLSAYFLPFKSFDGTYMDNLSFERVYRVYEFDRKLRNLFLYRYFLQSIMFYCCSLTIALSGFFSFADSLIS